MAKFYHENIHSENLLETNAWRTFREPITDATHFFDSSHAYLNVLDGTAVEAVVLTDATTLNIGHQYFIANDTTRTVGVYNYDSTLLTTFGANTRGFFFLNDNTTNAGDWLYLTAPASSAASYSIFGFYGGNANAGRVLEIYPGEASDDAPYIVVFPLAITAITLGASSPVTGTKTVGVFLTTDTVNPIATIDLLDGTDTAIKDGLFVTLAEGDRIFFRVTTGSILKPYITLYFAGV